MNESELLAVIRIFIQKTFDSTKPLQKPFRVIDAIDAHSEKQDVRTESEQEPPLDSAPESFRRLRPPRVRVTQR